MIQHAALMSAAANTQISPVLFVTFYMPSKSTSFTNMLPATIHMVQERVPLYNSINLLCITPSSLGHSWKVLCEYINTFEQWQ